jgi:hypothetical protein
VIQYGQQVEGFREPLLFAVGADWLLSRSWVMKGGRLGL